MSATLGRWNKEINPHHPPTDRKALNSRQKFMASMKKKRLEAKKNSQLHSTEVCFDEDGEKMDTTENSELFHLCSYCGISLRKGNLSNHIRTVHNCEVEESLIYDVSF